MCREAKILLVMSSLFTFGMGLSGIFVNVFFWKQTNDFIVIAVYNLIQYIVTPMAFLLGGILAKRKNGILSLRIGLGMFVAFYSVLLLIGRMGVGYIYLLGVIYGIAMGFYWLAFNTLSFDFTGLNNRDTFNGYNGSFCGITAAVAPLISGYIIKSFGGIKGYNIIFLTTLSIFIMLIFMSILLKCKSYGSKVDYKKAFLRNGTEWETVRKATVLWGFRDVIIVFLVNILIIETTKSELALGKLTLMGCLSGSLSYVLVQRIIKPRRRRMAIYIGTIFSFVAIWGLVYRVSYFSLLLYILMDAFFIPFFLIQLSSSTFNVISRAKEESMRIEYMINKDFALNTGRIISSIILLIMLIKFNDLKALKGYLIFIGLCPVFAGMLLSRLRRILEGV